MHNTTRGVSNDIIRNSNDGEIYSKDRYVNNVLIDIFTKNNNDACIVLSVTRNKTARS